MRCSSPRQPTLAAGRAQRVRPWQPGTLGPSLSLFMFKLADRSRPLCARPTVVRLAIPLCRFICSLCRACLPTRCQRPHARTDSYASHIHSTPARMVLAVIRHTHRVTHTLTSIHTHTDAPQLNQVVSRFGRAKAKYFSAPWLDSIANQVLRAGWRATLFRNRYWWLRLQYVSL